MKFTYKTEHPIIKEITIGDKFVLYDGTIVTFEHYDYTIIPFHINSKWYDSRLKFYTTQRNEQHPLDIKSKYIPLKDKLNLL